MDSPQEQETLEKQEQVSQGADLRRDKGGRRRMADVYQSNSLGHINAYNKARLEKGGHSAGTAEQGSSSHAAAPACSFGNDVRGDEDRVAHRGGDKDSDSPQRTQGHEDCTDRRAGIAARDVGGKGARLSIQQGAQPWTSEQAQQDQVPADCAGNEGQQFRSGMEQLRTDNYEEDCHACRSISEMSFRSLGAIQSEARGVAAFENRAVTGLAESTGAATGRATSNGASWDHGADGAALSQAGQVAPMVDLVEDDVEDLDMPDSQEVEFVPGTKKANRAVFKGASSPQKVAYLHLKSKKEKDKGKDGKDVKESV